MVADHVADDHAVHRAGNRNQRRVQQRQRADAPNAKRLEHRKQRCGELVHQGDGMNSHLGILSGIAASLVRGRVLGPAREQLQRMW